MFASSEVCKQVVTNRVILKKVIASQSNPYFIDIQRLKSGKNLKLSRIVSLNPHCDTI